MTVVRNTLSDDARRVACDALQETWWTSSGCR